MRNRYFLMALTVLALAGPILHAADPLTGTWKITVTQEEGNKSYEDSLVFTHTTLTSEALKKQGFEPSAYEADGRGVVSVTFTATMKNPKGGQAHWNGTGSANQLQGTLVVTRADGGTVNYSYKGERVKK